jgi:hypothetical protein
MLTSKNSGMDLERGIAAWEVGTLIYAYRITTFSKSIANENT